MCRWLAYSGTSIPLEELLLKRDRSLIDQSLHARLGATTTNGDGFGVGWYEPDRPPRVYRSVHPAWNQLWMHNGLIREFPRVKRDLVLAVDPSLFPSIEGTTDSEVMFYLALTFGLEDDPVAAVERMVGFVEKTGRDHGVDHPIQMTVATTDGTSIWAFRYSSERDSRSLYFSTRMDTLKALYPESVLRLLSDETRAVVSEPLGDLPGAWNEVPEAHVGIVQPGSDELRPFAPRA
jgi:glutamine amidotransferase